MTIKEIVQYCRLKRAMILIQAGRQCEAAKILISIYGGKKATAKRAVEAAQLGDFDKCAKELTKLK